MRETLGWLLLAFGVVVLGLWGRSAIAPAIEAAMQNSAEIVTAEQDLKHGAKVRVLGRDIVVSGVADSAAEKSDLTDALMAVQGRRVVRNDMEVLPQPDPFRITVDNIDGSLRATGAVLSEPLRTALADGDLGPGAANLVLSGGAPQGWGAAATAGVAALVILEQGTFDLSERTLTLRGEALNPAAKAEALAALDELPDGFAQTVELTLLDDGQPFRLDAKKSGTDLTTAGKLPNGFDLGAALSATGMAAAADETRRARIPDELGHFAPEAQAGLAALSALETGHLKVGTEGIALTGTTIGDEAALQVEAALAGLGAVVDLSPFDNGTPPAFEIAYDPIQGARLSGKLPRDLSLDQIAAAIGTGVIAEGRVLNSTTVDAKPDLQAHLEAVGDWLASAETLELRVPAEGKTFIHATMAPSVDLAQATQSLQKDLGSQSEVTLATAALPKDATERFNTLTGQQEALIGSFWVPVVGFKAENVSCRQETDAAVAKNPINFLSGAASLDSRSQRSLNVLASVLRHCVAEAGLDFEIEGHTDSTGDAAANLTLSQARADVVLQGLSARGIAASAMTARGYGATRPVADNATAEGRALNRRTIITFKPR